MRVKTLAATSARSASIGRFKPGLTSIAEGHRSWPFSLSYSAPATGLDNQSTRRVSGTSHGTGAFSLYSLITTLSASSAMYQPVGIECVAKYSLSVLIIPRGRFLSKMSE